LDFIREIPNNNFGLCTGMPDGKPSTPSAAKPLTPGNYMVILRVNGEQADDAPTVNWT